MKKVILTLVMIILLVLSSLGVYAGDNDPCLPGTGDYAQVVTTGTPTPPVTPPAAPASGEAATPTPNPARFIHWIVPDTTPPFASGVQISQRGSHGEQGEFARVIDPVTGEFTYYTIEDGQIDWSSHRSAISAHTATNGWRSSSDSPTGVSGHDGDWQFLGRGAQQNPTEGSTARVCPSGSIEGCTYFRFNEEEESWEETEPMGSTALKELMESGTLAAEPEAGAETPVEPGAEPAATATVETADEPTGEEEEEAPPAQTEPEAEECIGCAIAQTTQGLAAGDYSSVSDARTALETSIGATEREIQERGATIASRGELITGLESAIEHIESGDVSQLTEEDLNHINTIMHDPNNEFSDEQELAAQRLWVLAGAGDDDPISAEDFEALDAGILQEVVAQMAQQQTLDETAQNQAEFERQAAQALLQSLGGSLSAEQIQQRASWREQLYTREGLAYNSLSDDIENAHGDIQGVLDAFGSYARRTYGYNPESFDNFIGDRTTERLSGLIEERNLDYDEKDGIPGPSSEEEIAGYDDLVAEARGQVIGAYDLGDIDPDSPEGMRALMDAATERFQSTYALSGPRGDTPGAGTTLLLPPGQRFPEHMQFTTLNDKNELIGHTADGREVNTHFRCYGCETTEYGDEGQVLSGGIEDGARLQAPDGTVYDVEVDEDGNVEGYRTRQDYWVQNSLMDWVKGGPVTGFLKGLSSIVGSRCKACEGSKLYEAFGKIDLASTWTDRICDNNVEGLGESFAVSKTGGPSQAWVVGEITEVGSICDAFGQSSSESQLCTEEIMPPPYIYKIQAYVNAQEVKMEFNICLTDDEGDCDESGSAHVWNLLRYGGDKKDLVLDPEDDPEDYGPPVLDWHGPYTKVFPAGSVYQYVCIKFKNAGTDQPGLDYNVAAFITLEEDYLCNELPLTTDISPYDSDYRQWEGPADWADTSGSGSFDDYNPYVGPGALDSEGAGGSSHFSSFDPGEGGVP